MYELLSAFDWLAERFPSTNQRLVITLLALGAFLAVVLTYRDAYEWIEDRSRPLYADLVMTVALVTTSVLTVAVILGTWGQTDELRRIYEGTDLGAEVVARLVFSVVVLIGTAIVVRFLRRLLHDLLGSSSSVTEHQERVSHRVTQVTIWSVAVVVVLGIWVDDLAGLLVGAGFLGIVVGMAARQTLGSMIAGFVLMFARPFEVGDWIVVDDREGIVSDISIVNTRVETFDGEFLMIPNDVVGSSMVTNRSRNGRLRLEVEVGVDYGTDVDRATALTREAVADVEAALAEPEPRVITKEFGESAVVLGLRFWVDEPTARRCSTARSQAVGAIKSRFEAAGITIPFPQRTLSERTTATSGGGEERTT